MPQFHFDKTEAADLTAAVGCFEVLALASPFRSTVPLVAFLRDAWPATLAILAACGMENDPAIHFEYRVTSPKGPPGEDPRPSQTDAMVIGQAGAVAIEAKWTEPRYPSVSKRLERVPIEIAKLPLEQHDRWRHGQRLLMDGWLELLKPHTARPLQVEAVGEVVYQMLHRAASASAVSPCPSLIYLHFEAENWRKGASEGQYRKDLRALWKLLGEPATFPFYLVTVPMTFQPAFETIRLLKKRTKPTDRAVRQALVDTTLFEFGEPRIERIVGDS